jgi:hypothetical protein
MNGPAIQGKEHEMTQGNSQLAVLILVVGVLCALAGCAHRGRPPECKGPYTPINQSLVAASDGTQR